MFATADLCDAFPDRVRWRSPSSVTSGASAGSPDRSRPLRVFEDNALVRQALESPGQGRVLVVDGGGSLRCALVGGRLAGARAG